MQSQLDASYHSYPQFLHLNCLPGFLIMYFFCWR
nr:MAG TPA: hypothetical protein [Bacteriophage sp.]